MKDLDDLLKTHNPKPNRQLNADFTKDITTHLQEHPRKQGPGRLLFGLKQRLHTRMGILSVIGLVLISGTAAALAVWPHPTVQQSLNTQLPSGNHIVGYNTTDCNYFSEVQDAATTPTNDTVYYEIKHGSKLTDKQLQSSLLAQCEENLSSGTMGKIIKSLPNNIAKSGFSTPTLTVQAITPTSITVGLDPHYDRTQYEVKDGLVYEHFSGQLVVYSQSAKAAYSDLKVGDSIQMFLVPKTGTPAAQGETPNNFQPINDPQDITVAAIIRVLPLTGDPTLFYTHLAVDFVRVEHCKSSPTGFCRQYPFVNDIKTNGATAQPGTVRYPDGSTN